MHVSLSNDGHDLTKPVRCRLRGAEAALPT
jgi:hypothetical protein